jgi:hypothetical protein
MELPRILTTPGVSNGSVMMPSGVDVSVPGTRVIDAGDAPC